MYANIFQAEQQLTACVSYNRAFIFGHPDHPATREILFSSYEQMENKLTKF